MNDKDRDLIAQVLKAAGSAGEKGFEYLTRYTFTSGIAGLLTSLCVIGFAVYLFRRLLAWKPEKDFDSAEKHAVRGISMAAIAIVIVVCISSMQCELSSVLAPEGAAIYSVLHK